MQLTLGRRWILELRFSVSLRQRMEAACGSVRFTVDRRGRDRTAEIAWERDKLSGVMLSGWDRHLPPLMPGSATSRDRDRSVLMRPPAPRMKFDNIFQ